MRSTPLFTLVAAAAAAPAGAWAATYLSAEQAAQLMFPQADRWEVRSAALSASQLKQLAGSGVSPRSAQWNLRLAWQGSKLLGLVVTDDVVGKFELISYAVGLSAEGTVQQVEVLAYRESHGHEIRLPAWRKQFVGKNANAPIRLGDDIANISGATLSCSHVTDGVRRIVAVVHLLRQAGGWPA